MFFSALLLSAVVTATPGNHKDVTQLSPRPNSCVSLHQGRECFATITFKWQVQKIGHYCLFDELQAKPLRCWTNAKHGQLTYEFKSAKDITFVLREAKSEQAVASSKISVSWLYNSSNKKRRWRIF